MTTIVLASGAPVDIDETLYAFVRDEVVPGTGKTVPGTSFTSNS